MLIGLGMVLIGLSVEDYFKKEIPICGILLEFAFAVGIVLFQEKELWNHIGGALFGMGIIVLSVLTKEKIGMGDGIVLSILGLALGIHSVFWIFLLALFFSGIFSGMMLCFRKYSWKSTLPFIPFITMGYMGVTFW